MLLTPLLKEPETAIELMFFPPPPTPFWPVTKLGDTYIFPKHLE